MKRVAFAVGRLSEDSGIIKVVKNIAIELSIRGYDIVIITTGFYNENGVTKFRVGNSKL